MKFKSLLLYILFFSLGMASFYGLLRIKEHYAKMIRFGLPSNDSVCLDSTNLPIILINTVGRIINKQDYI